MSTLDQTAPPGLARPLGLSALLHAGAIAALLLLHAPAPPALPPIYKVALVAAPAAPRAIGVLETVVPVPPPLTAPPPPRAATPPKAMPMPARPSAPPRKVPPPATPVAPTATPPKTPAPPAVAGGGPTGDRGTDVATVRTEGIDFPYPGYLENIVRQISLRFEAPNGAPRHAELSFLIHRDGSISNLEFTSRSGLFAFDQEAEGAIDAAGSVRAFGPLPDGFADDVLPVVFSFDPRAIR